MSDKECAKIVLQLINFKIKIKFNKLIVRNFCILNCRRAMAYNRTRGNFSFL